MAGINGPNIVTDGLVLYVDASNTKSYSGSGTTWSDISGNSYDGTLTNDPVYSSNNKGYFTFDQYDYSEHTDILDMGTSDLTISCWINLSSTRGVHSWFQSKARAANVAARYAVGLQSNTEKLRSFFAPVVNVDILTIGSTELQVDQWYMVTTVYDRSDDMIQYVNGVQESSTTYINNSVTSSGISNYSSNDIQSNYPYRIGAYTASDNVGLYQNRGFMGNIALLMHYNRALTQAEIQQNFNAHRGRFSI